MKTLLLILLSIDSQFYYGVVASAVVAVLALFAFFLLLRPKIKIMPIVAYGDSKMNSNDYMCQVSIKNIGIFACTDIRIKASSVGVTNNDGERDEPIKEENFLSLSGCFHDENKSVLEFRFPLENKGIPGQMRLSVLAKHSVSGVEYGCSKIFRATDFQEGRYERGVFVRKDNTYKHAIMRHHTKMIKYIVPIILCLYAIIVTILSLSLNFCFEQTIALIVVSLLALILMFIIWHYYIQSKASAYSSVFVYRTIEHVIERTLIGIIEKRDKKQTTSVNKNNAEDVLPESMNENN